MKRKYQIVGIICSALAVLCLVYAFWPQDDTDPIQAMVDLPAVLPVKENTVTAASPNDDIANIPDVTAKNDELPREDILPDDIPEEPEAYVSPIDFSLIQAQNPDIYGWLSVPGTDISYPLLQREGDDKFYLTHDSSAEQAKAGAIFTESEYNSRDMNDPVTLIYGHRMNSGSRFGRLQETYEEDESFNEHSEVIVYLPDRELHYRVFAAVSHSNTHIMSEYDFNDAEDYEDFLKLIYKSKGNFCEEFKATTNDKTVILSTCMRWNSNKRYLVLAKLIN